MPVLPAVSCLLPSRRARVRTRGGAFFSPREREILRLLGDGRSVGAIASELGVTPSTVRTFRTALREKLGCADAAAVGGWVRSGVRPAAAGPASARGEFS